MPDEIVQTTENVLPAGEVTVPEVAPAPVVENPVDISPEEFAAGVRTLEQSMATAWASRELTTKQLISQVEDPDQRQQALSKLELEKAQWQVASQLIPMQLAQRNNALQEIAKQTGVPVSVLATAKSQEDVTTLINAWGKAHPKAAPTPAPTEVVQATGTKIDSGVNTGTGAGKQEVWRNMSAADKIAWALRS